MWLQANPGANWSHASAKDATSHIKDPVYVLVADVQDGHDVEAATIKIDVKTGSIRYCPFNAGKYNRAVFLCSILPRMVPGKYVKGVPGIPA